MTRAYVISDLHLGGGHTRHDDILGFLHNMAPGALLVLNGDVVEWEKATLTPADEQILAHLRARSATQPVIWVRGNHDDRYEIDAPGEIRFCTSYAFDSRLLVSHGHHFDKVMPRNKLFKRVFRLLARIREQTGGNHVHMAKYAKRFPRLYAVLCDHVARNAAAYARQNGFAAVTCGHTHFAEERVLEGVRYLNTGAWTESPSHYLEIDEHAINLKRYG